MLESALRACFRTSWSRTAGNLSPRLVNKKHQSLSLNPSYPGSKNGLAYYNLCFAAGSSVDTKAWYHGYTTLQPRGLYGSLAYRLFTLIKACANFEPDVGLPPATSTLQPPLTNLYRRLMVPWPFAIRHFAWPTSVQSHAEGAGSKSLAFTLQCRCTKKWRRDFLSCATPVSQLPLCAFYSWLLGKNEKRNNYTKIQWSMSKTLPQYCPLMIPRG